MCKTLVVGWDAVSWDYVELLLETGGLPNLETLIENGSKGILTSTVPPITPVAWSSVITGKLPQGHGVYDWITFRDGEDRVATSLSRSGTPFWDRLGAKGIRAGLANVPMTYPPQPINGFILCGFGAPPDAEDLCYPPALKRELESAFGAVNTVLTPEQSESLARAGTLLKEEERLQHQQVKMALYLAGQYKVDLLIINLMLFDHSNHRSRSFEEVIHSLRAMDYHLGELIEVYEPEDVILFGDHGSRRVAGEFLIGDWLRDKGYLARSRRANQIEKDLNFFLQDYLGSAGISPGKLERTLRFLIRKTLPHWPSAMSRRFWQSGAKLTPRAHEHYWFSEELDTERSKIARLRRTGLLYMNRSKSSAVQPENDEALVDQLVDDLKGIVDQEANSPIFRQIYRSAELYGSDNLGSPPDLVLDYHGSRFALFTHKGTAFKLRKSYFAMAEDNPNAAVWSWRGDHKPEGICVLSGESFSAGADIGVNSIVDISATLLHLFDVAIPDDFDGSVLTNALREQRAVRQQPGDRLEEKTDRKPADQDLEDEAMIEERLRALGYLE